MSVSTPTRIRVGSGQVGDAAGPNSYDVVVGSGLLGELPGLLAGARRVLVVHPRALRTTGEAVRAEGTALACLQSVEKHMRKQGHNAVRRVRHDHEGIGKENLHNVARTIDGQL